MYIRRKVFSALTNEMGEERLFSTTDYVLDQYEFSSAAQKLRREAYERKLAEATGNGELSVKEAKRLVRKASRLQTGSNLNHLVNTGKAGAAAREAGQANAVINAMGGDVAQNKQNFKNFLKKGYDYSYGADKAAAKAKDFDKLVNIANKQSGTGSLVVKKAEKGMLDRVKNIYAKHPLAAKTAIGTTLALGATGLGYEGYKHYKNRENGQD